MLSNHTHCGGSWADLSNELVSSGMSLLQASTPALVEQYRSCEMCGSFAIEVPSDFITDCILADLHRKTRGGSLIYLSPCQLW